MQGMGARLTLGQVARVASLSAARVAGSMSAFVTSIGLAAVLPPEEFGALMGFISGAVLLSFCLTLNIEAGALRFHPSYKKNQTPQSSGAFVLANVGVLLAISLLLCLFTIFVGYKFAPSNIKLSQADVLLTLAAATTLALSRIIGRHGNALGHPQKALLPLLALQPMLFCAFSFFYCVLAGQPSVRILLLLFAASAGVAVLMQFWTLRELRPVFLRFRQSVTFDKDWIKQGLLLVPNSAIHEHMKHLIVVFAVLVLPMETVGQLALALSLVSFFQFGLRAIDMTLAPDVSLALQTSDQSKARQILRTSALLKLIYTAIAGSVLTSLVYAFAGHFFPDAALLHMMVFILLLIPVSEMVFGPNALVLLVLGHARKGSTRAVICLAMLFVAVVLGGRYLGGLAAAAGAAMTLMLYHAALCHLAQDLSGMVTSVRCLKVLRVSVAKTACAS